jgi:hypothetical protein
MLKQKLINKLKAHLIATTGGHGPVGIYADEAVEMFWPLILDATRAVENNLSCYHYTSMNKLNKTLMELKNEC